MTRRGSAAGENDELGVWQEEMTECRVIVRGMKVQPEKMTGWRSVAGVNDGSETDAGLL
jgi:hypothetical protein